jgi:hypothetical protein
VPCDIASECSIIACALATRNLWFILLIQGNDSGETNDCYWHTGDIPLSLDISPLWHEISRCCTQSSSHMVHFGIQSKARYDPLTIPFEWNTSPGIKRLSHPWITSPGSAHKGNVGEWYNQPQLTRECEMRVHLCFH